MKTKRCVLIVSRDRAQFEGVTDAIESAGHSIVWAADNQSAMSKISKRMPDLVLAELAWVDIDGPDLCRRTRRITGARNMPVVLVGDLPKRSPIVIDAESCGAAAYYQRPFTPKALVKKCLELIEAREQVDFTSEKVAAKSKTRKEADVESKADLTKGYCWLYGSDEKGAMIKVYLPKADRRSVGVSLGDTFPSALSLVGAEDAAYRLTRLILDACQVMVVEKNDADRIPDLAFAE